MDDNGGSREAHSHKKWEGLGTLYTECISIWEGSGYVYSSY